MRNNYVNAVKRPITRKKQVANWILEHRASVISRPVEAGLRKFAGGGLRTVPKNRITPITKDTLTHAVFQVINEFEAAVPH